jgi:hypothetical protein
MTMFKFGDKIKTTDGKEGIVQEDQESTSGEIKVILEGEDAAKIFREEELTPVEGE